MIHLSIDSSKSSDLRKRQSRRSRTLRHQLGFERLEDRCLLTTYTTPAAFTPVAEMVYGPAGDVWFSRSQDLSITRIAGDGTLSEFGVFSSTQPVNLEVDANDNLWFTSASNAPANHLFRITPAGAVTEISDFTTVFNFVSQDPVPPVAFLTHGHINEDNSGVLVGLKADGTTSFYPLPTGVTVGPGQYWARPFSLAVDGRGDFWYTDNDAVNLRTTVGEYAHLPLPDVNDQAQSMALGGDGNMWFVENSLHASPSGDVYYVADKIGKIAPNATITTVDVKLAGFRLKIGPLVKGSDGSIWFDQVGVEEDGVTPEPNTHRIGRIGVDGTITRYIPPDPATGPTTFAAVAVSPSGGVADSPTFIVTPFLPQASIVEAHAFAELTAVNPVNQAPVAVNDSYLVPGGTVTVARPGVLGNDTDANSDALRAILLTGPSHGTLTLNPSGSFTYVASTGFHGADSFTYKANDGLLDSSPATVSITVPVDNNDPPQPAQLGPFASMITHSQEHFGQFVSSAYQQFLGRAPDDAGLNSWVSRMQAGLTDEQLEAGLIGSAEYIASHGGAGAAWVQGLYRDVLGRTAALSELNLWLNQLQSGASPHTVALDIAASREREGNRVRADYQTFLGRTPGQPEVDSWVNSFANGLDNEGLVAGFLSSFEYYNDAAKGNRNNLNWIQSATQDELARSPSAAEITTALTSLTPGNLAAVAGQITHAIDHYRQLVSNAYQQYLGRKPDDAGLSVWVSHMQAGLTDEQLEAGFIGSREYIANHGGTGPAWVQSLYHDILGRAPAQSEVDSWVAALNSGVSPQAVAFGFAASREREGNRIRGDYQTFLGRTAAQSEVDSWVNGFARGVTNEDLVTGFLGSTEYFNAPTKGKSDKADWVLNAVLDELQRTPTTDEFNAWEGMLL